MGEIISIEKYRTRSPKINKTTKTSGISNDNQTIDRFIEYMGNMVQNIIDNPRSERVIQCESKSKKEFEAKNSDVLIKAPISVVGKIQYFAGIMLNFLPAIFHSEQTDRFDTYMYFSKFYLSEFDTAYSQYCSVNQEYEKEYPFRFIPMDTNKLENSLQNCLNQIIAMFPDKNDNNKTKIMWQSCKSFELYHNMENLFSGKIQESDNQHDPFS